LKINSGLVAGEFPSRLYQGFRFADREFWSFPGIEPIGASVDFRATEPIGAFVDFGGSDPVGAFVDFENLRPERNQRPTGNSGQYCPLPGETELGSAGVQPNKG